MSETAATDSGIGGTSGEHASESQQPVALVTGGATGIGYACAGDLVSRGWRVIISGRRKELLHKAAGEPGAVDISADVSDPDQCAALIERTQALFGRLDGLVLSGSSSGSGPFASLGHELWATTVMTNIVGNADLCRAALPLLMRTRGSIVAVSSIASMRASSFMSAYAASKAGLGMLIKSLAVEFGPQGVRANAVCPCWVRTAMADRSMGVLMERNHCTLDEAYALATDVVPLGRAAAPEEVSSVVAFLLSKEASFINAALIPVDGGASAVDVGALGYR
ncbi:MAG: SDR family oxidoreductase [Bifidobacterium tibiigranuli]|jgi:NAD(P)-dependent dehydrogenase (short-subunit alcohol dehydrogenase family)|nr:SDR family oxidoreductase [Bifidobacterium tibiigranuli]